MVRKVTKDECVGTVLLSKVTGARCIIRGLAPASQVGSYGPGYAVEITDGKERGTKLILPFKNISMFDVVDE